MATVRAGISDFSGVEGSRDRRLAEVISIRPANDKASSLGLGESTDYNINVETVGSKIKARRLSLGLTQKQLAESSGYTNGWISAIERDIERPTRQFLIDIELALGVPLGTWSHEWKDQRKVGDVGDKLMTPTEVSRYLDVSRGVVYAYIHRSARPDEAMSGICKNKLPVVVVDKYFRVAIADLARWICIEDGRLQDAQESGACEDSLLMLIGQEEQAIRKWLSRERS